MLGLLNCFVHVIMYSYYFLTSFNPELKRSAWWKKHITQLQLVSFAADTHHITQRILQINHCSAQVQFAILIIHFLHPIVFTECAYPKALSFIGLSQNLFMFLLFSDFYYKAYIKRKIE